MTSDSRPDHRSTLERALGLFAEVRAGEGPLVLLLMVNIFLVLTTYYILKPVREALILAVEGGAELKSYMSAGQGLLLLLIVPAYSALASRLPRARLILVVNCAFIACMVLFYLAAKAGFSVGVVFFLWVGIFSVMVVAQFWSFANDLYTEEQGRRLFAIVGFGQSVGAAFGSKIAGWLIRPVGVYELLLVAAGVLALSLALSAAVERIRRARRSATDAVAAQTPTDQTPTDQTPTEPQANQEPNDDAPVGKGGAWEAFRLVARNRYLLLLACLFLFLNWVNSTGEYLLGRIVKDSAVQAGGDIGAFIGGFYADFYFVVNIVGLLIQLFLVSRILKYLGVRWALLILPLIAFGGYLLILVYPLLSIIRWAKTAENSTDYSLQNTLRGVLYLPTTREQKYQAKQAIDTIFVRAGDVLSALLVFVGTTWLHLSTSGFATVNLLLVAVWLALAVAIGREYHRLAQTAPPPPS